MSADTVRLDVTLRRNDTGAEVSYQLSVAREDDGTPSVWIFDGGNWSCDCNRLLDWERHGGDVDGLPECNDRHCMGGWEGLGLFSLRAAHDGHVIYADGWFARKPVVAVKRFAHDTLLSELGKLATLPPPPTHILVSCEMANRMSTAPHTASDFQPLAGPTGNFDEHRRLAGLPPFSDSFKRGGIA